MPQLKLRKETNELGETFYSLELDGKYIAGSVTYGGNANTPEDRLNEMYADAVKKYDEYIANWNPANKKNEVIREQDI